MPQVTVRQPARLLRLVLGSPLWIGGSLALASGFGAQLVVYRTLPIAAAQGIFVSGLVILVLLSSVLLGEETSGRERYAIGAILVALLMVVLSLKEGSDTVSRSTPAPLILLVCVPSLALGVWLYASAERRAPPPPAPHADHGRRIRRGGGPVVRGQLAGHQGRVELPHLKWPRRCGGRPAPLPVPLSPAVHGRVRPGDVAGGAAALPGLADRAGLHDGDVSVHRGARHARVRRGAARGSAAAGAAHRRYGVGGLRTPGDAQARPAGAARSTITARSTGRAPTPAPHKGVDH